MRLTLDEQNFYEDLFLKLSQGGQIFDETDCLRLLGRGISDSSISNQVLPLQPSSPLLCYRSGTLFPTTAPKTSYLKKISTNCLNTLPPIRMAITSKKLLLKNYQVNPKF